MGRSVLPPRLVLDARLLHYNRTGIGRYLRHLYGAVARRLRGCPSFDVAVLLHRRDRERALDEPPFHAATAWTPAHHRLERWLLAVEAARLRPRVFHAPDHICPEPLGWLTVLTIHDLAFRRFPETHSAASRAYYAGLERSIRQATRVICVSEATRQDLLTLTGCPPDKVRVVYEAPGPEYGVDGPAATSERPYIVCVGTIEPRKNYQTIFAALARLPAGERPALHVIGGRGHDADQILSLVPRLGLDGDVRLLGHLPAGEVAAQYRGALALLYPSLLEGFGLPILEAMACGTPVITSDRSSMPEVAGDAAELVNPMAVESVAEAMRRVAGDAAHRAELRRRGFARVGRFSWDEAARQTLDVFAEALAA